MRLLVFVVMLLALVATPPLVMAKSKYDVAMRILNHKKTQQSGQILRGKNGPNNNNHNNHNIRRVEGGGGGSQPEEGKGKGGYSKGSKGSNGKGYNGGGEYNYWHGDDDDDDQFDYDDWYEGAGDDDDDDDGKGGGENREDDDGDETPEDNSNQASSTEGPAIVQPACQLTEVAFFADDFDNPDDAFIMGDPNGSPGSNGGFGIPIYDPSTANRVGTLMEHYNWLPDADCLYSGAWTFDGSGSYPPGQMFYQGTCRGDRSAITGGTFDYSCASGVDFMVGENATTGMVFWEIWNCGNSCPV